MLSDVIEAVIIINLRGCKTGSEAFLKPFLYMEIINNFARNMLMEEE